MPYPAPEATVRRRYDANTVVITIGGMHRKQDESPDVVDSWEKRLSAGRRAIEMAAFAATTTVVPVQQPRRTSLQRSKIVQTSSLDGRRMRGLEEKARRRHNDDCDDLQPDQTCDPSPSTGSWAHAGEVPPPLPPPDRSVFSTYQPLTVDLDDDAIMV